MCFSWGQQYNSFFSLQVALTFLILWLASTPPTYQLPLWSANFSKGTTAALTMVQTHPTPTWSTETPPPPRVKWPPSPSLRGSEETPLTTILCLWRATLSVWGYREGFKQVSTWAVVYICQQRNRRTPHSHQCADVPSFKFLGFSYSSDPFLFLITYITTISLVGLKELIFFTVRILQNQLRQNSYQHFCFQ